MNANSRDGRGAGELVGVAESLPPAVLDCSGWESDIPDDQWCVGPLEGATESLPPAAVDCSGWTSQTATWLEVVVSFEESMPPTQVIESTKRLVAIAQAGDPGLGLTYDFNRSRTEKDDVVIALSTTVTAEVDNRLNGVAEAIRRETAHFPGVLRLVTTVTRANRAA